MTDPAAAPPPASPSAPSNPGSDGEARLYDPAYVRALVEVSSPPGRALRATYLLYLKQVIPVLGRILLGNPENYRMLGRYTERFGDAGRLVPVFAAAGLDVAGLSLFFGCATGIVGRKPGS
ncbi:MAG: hypothetical protein A2V85_13810 [Chloroflexi bacterium RBG_16_72_14]|nr:MAG: hypothetical protein A2V85_13810 [Chloroflexi bacterium RBG_16_72_14]